jgi:hypothetical protein
MRPFSHDVPEKLPKTNAERVRFAALPLLILVTTWLQQVGGVILSPATATLAANHRVTLTAQVAGVTNAGMAWTVNGIAGGNSTIGQICTVSVNPCQPVTHGTAAQVDYLAPDPVTVQATSAADSTKSATSQITVINHVVVTVQPASVTLAPLAVQGFTATGVYARDHRGRDRRAGWQRRVSDTDRADS